MVRYAICLAVFSLLFVISSVCSYAQQQAPQIPQIVQLPTFSFFTVSTTVSVPDRGTVYLGGVKRSRRQSSTRGVPGLSQLPHVGRLFKNQGIAASTTSSGAHVTATIIDHSELDHLMLSEAAARRRVPLEVSSGERKASFLSSNVGRRDHTSLVMSRGAPTSAKASSQPHIDVASAQREQADRVAMYLERAKRAERVGNIGSAQCSYRVVSRRGTPSQKKHALARLAAIETVGKRITPAPRDR